MSQSRRQRSGRRARGQADSPEVRIVYRNQIGKKTAIAIGSVVLVLILVIVGIFYYPTYIAPFHTTVLTVEDDVSIKMDYFLKRIRVSGSDPMAMLTNLAQEEIAKKEAVKLGINVTDADIEEQLRLVAAGDSGTITDAEFKEWYRQRLNETGLSDSEYKDIVKTGIIINRIYNIVATQMPTSVAQIHPYVMLVDTEDHANAIRDEVLNGADFTQLAMENSLDSATRDNGGDLGWVPYGVLDPRIEYPAWQMSTGNVSDPLIYYSSDDPQTATVLGYYLIWLKEKTDSMEVDQKYISTLQANALDAWFADKMSTYEIRYHGFKGGFDSETYAWIQWQLSKTSSSSQSSSSSSP